GEGRSVQARAGHPAERTCGKPAGDRVLRIANSTRFKNLERYRNCSTHRRQIYIETTTRSATPGYKATGLVLSIVRHLCDDPLATNARTKQKRELLLYCTGMFDWVQKQLTKAIQQL